MTASVTWTLTLGEAQNVTSVLFLTATAFTNGVVDESKIAEFVPFFPNRNGPHRNLTGTQPVATLTTITSGTRLDG